MKKGCEIIKCKDYINGECLITEEYVNKITGELMCPKNDNAIPRAEWIFGPGHVID